MSLKPNCPPPANPMTSFAFLSVALCAVLRTLPSLPAAIIDLGPSSRVDWLAASGSEVSPFSLTDEAGRSAAGLEVGGLEGQSPPGAISSTFLSSTHWVTAVPTENGTLTALKFRLLPSAGKLRFETSIAISLLGADGLLLCVGGLDGQTGATLQVRGLDASGDVVVPEYLGAAAWNPGTGGYLNPLSWLSETRTFQASGTTSGTTEFGWLWFASNDLAKVELGYHSVNPRFSGEGFVLGLGLVTIPEPGSALLLLVSAVIAAGRRR